MKKVYLSLFVIAATVLATVIRLFDTSDIILHWNVNGNVDWRGTHYALIVLPVVSILLYQLFRYYKKHPEKYNFSFKVVNEDAVYSILKEGNSWICLDVMVLLLYVTLCASGYLYLHLAIICGLVILALFLMTLFYTKAIKANKRNNAVQKQ